MPTKVTIVQRFGDVLDGQNLNQWFAFVAASVHGLNGFFGRTLWRFEAAKRCLRTHHPLTWPFANPHRKGDHQ
jgi:hypothetical protein